MKRLRSQSVDNTAIEPFVLDKLTKSPSACGGSGRYENGTLK